MPRMLAQHGIFHVTREVKGDKWKNRQTMAMIRDSNHTSHTHTLLFSAMMSPRLAMKRVLPISALAGYKVKKAQCMEQEREKEEKPWPVWGPDKDADLSTTQMFAKMRHVLMSHGS